MSQILVVYSRWKCLWWFYLIVELTFFVPFSGRPSRTCSFLGISTAITALNEAIETDCALTCEVSLLSIRILIIDFYEKSGCPWWFIERDWSLMDRIDSCAKRSLRKRRYVNVWSHPCSMTSCMVFVEGLELKAIDCIFCVVIITTMKVIEIFTLLTTLTFTHSIYYYYRSYNFPCCNYAKNDQAHSVGIPQLSRAVTISRISGLSLNNGEVHREDSRFIITYLLVCRLHLISHFKKIFGNVNVISLAGLNYWQC